MKKEGFTLIEMLSVIVVIGIIGLLVTPVVISYIEKSNKEVLKTSAYGLIGAADNEYKRILMKGFVDNYIIYVYNEGEKTSTLNGSKLEYKGQRPKSGNVVINRDGEIALSISDGKYCFEKLFNESEVKENPEKSFYDCYVDVELYEE